MIKNLENCKSQKVSIEEIEKNLKVLYDSRDSSNRWQAQKFLTGLQPSFENRELIYTIIESEEKNTVFYGLQLLDKILNSSWDTFPIFEKRYVLSFVIRKIFFHISMSGQFSKNSPIVIKLNLALIKIVSKQNKEHLLTLLSDLTSSAKISEQICENNLQIIQIILEEIRENFFPKNRFKPLFLKLNDIFCLRRVENLCCFIFQQSCVLVNLRPSLIINALNAFERILFFSQKSNYHFLPLSINSLINLCFEKQIRNHALNCLFELDNHLKDFDLESRNKIITNFAIQFQEILPLSENFVEFFCRSGSESKYFLVKSITFFLKFLKTLVIPGSNQNFSKTFFFTIQQYFLKISCLPQLEIFKICLDWWEFLFYKFEEKKKNRFSRGFPEFVFFRPDDYFDW